MTTSPLRDCGLRALNIRGDDRGSLVAIEAMRDVPFPIARVYYIFGTKSGVDRGFHAHRDLRQWAVCVSGSCVMDLDDGAARETFVLDRPDVALEIGPMIWREMSDFSPDAVLLVLASKHYDDSDYIRDYDVFVALARDLARRNAR